MTQNIYDDPAFFEGYSRLPRSVKGLDGAPEWPALQALLPPMQGARVVDLGCGYGWFCRWARTAGAAQVLGFDVSEKMLARAQSEGADPGIVYARADLETIELPHAAFDLAYSSLALHYIVNLDRLFATIHAALKAGGRFVFSAEHPLMTAPTRPGWATLADGKKIWPVERYAEEGPRTTDWIAKGVVKQHRTIATYVNLLIAAGFTVQHLDEWAPSPAQVAQHPAWADERQRPCFLLAAAVKT